jgi:hypothetical protein
MWDVLTGAATAGLSALGWGSHVSVLPYQELRSTRIGFSAAVVTLTCIQEYTIQEEACQPLRLFPAYTSPGDTGVGLWHDARLTSAGGEEWATKIARLRDSVPGPQYC